MLPSDQQYDRPSPPHRARVELGLRLSIACLVMSIVMIVGVLWGLSASYSEPSQPVVATEPVAPIDFSQPAWAVTVPTLKRVRSLPIEPAQRHPLAPSIYQQSMTVGYAAYQQKDYQTALINFRRALTDKADDPYATEAIANTEAILQKQRDAVQEPEQQRESIQESQE